MEPPNTGPRGPEDNIFLRKIEVSRLALNRLQAAWIALVLFLAAPRARSQSADAALNLPDAPYPSLQAAGSQTNSAPPANGSSSQTSPASATTPSGAQTSPPVTAEEQLKQQEKQRILV